MAGKALELGGPIRLADYLSIGLLARLVPPDVVSHEQENGVKENGVRPRFSPNPSPCLRVGSG